MQRTDIEGITFVGLAEGAEGTNLTVFIEDCIQSLLPDAHLSPYYMVERAHRILPKLGSPGSPPQTFILKLLNFCSWDEILWAHIHGDLRFQNNKLLIFPDE